MDNHGQYWGVINGTMDNCGQYWGVINGAMDNCGQYWGIINGTMDNYGQYWGVINGTMDTPMDNIGGAPGCVDKFATMLKICGLRPQKEIDLKWKF